MLCIRPVKETDFDDVFALAKMAGPGLTSLLPDPDKILKKIQKSVQSFSSEKKLKDAQYVFVLEDLETKKVVGTTAIYANIADGGFHSYRVKEERVYSKSLDKKLNRDFLVLDKSLKRASMIGTLFLHPDYRGGGVGKFLSLSRFLFVAAYPKLFRRKFLAEIRGYFDEEGESPYWNYMCAKYFGMDFLEAKNLARTKGYRTFYELMPKNPIPLFLIPNRVSSLIGKAHKYSKPAQALLEKQGFIYNGSIDFFDGGPQLTVATKQINIVKNTKEFRVGNQIKDANVDGQRCLIASGLTDKKNFRIVMGQAKIDGSLLGMSDDLKKALAIKSDTPVLACPL